MGKHQSMKKIFFLVHSKCSLEIIIKFIEGKIKNIFLKKKIKKFKRENKKFLKTKKISNDFFSSNAYFFYSNIKKLKEKFSYLEIGSFEGNSSMFVARTFRNSILTCVDPWIKTEDYEKKILFSQIERNFRENVKKFGNIKIIKSESDNFFSKNKEKFDIIYIDGYHLAKQVYNDCKNAWKILKKPGIMICDDYMWSLYNKYEDNPCFAINKFLREINNNFKILAVSNNQIFIKKIL